MCYIEISLSRPGPANSLNSESELNITRLFSLNRANRSTHTDGCETESTSNSCRPTPYAYVGVEKSFSTLHIVTDKKKTADIPRWGSIVRSCRSSMTADYCIWGRSERMWSRLLVDFADQRPRRPYSIKRLVLIHGTGHAAAANTRRLTGMGGSKGGGTTTGGTDPQILVRPNFTLDLMMPTFMSHSRMIGAKPPPCCQNRL